MHRRARSILRGEQGLSMILVLCIGALFVALSAALVYAASVLTANANRQLLEQEAYQLATSFSDVLEGELNDKDSSFAKFVNGQFMFSQSYGKDIYDLESQPKEFVWKPNGSQPDGGAEAITVTLRRRPGDGADKLNQTANSTIATDLRNLLDTLEGEDRKGMAIVDLQLDITVTVTKNGESFAFTRTYDRTVKYDSDGSQAKSYIFPKVYYTINDGTTKYYRISELTFFAPGVGEKTIDDNNISSNRLTFHCDTSQQPDSITSQRGETIVEVLVSFLLLMIFTSMFVVSLRYARAMSQKAETLRETAYAFCAGLYPANNAAPNWVKERDGLEFSFGDYGEFVVEGVELDSVETSAEVTENGQKTTEQHKFYRYSKSTAEGTTNP